MAVPRTDWQLGCVQLNQRCAHLLQRGQWADCMFIVGSPPNQVTITAHKLILASASPVFEAMFYGGMAERDGPIHILDVQPDAFKSLLKYIYTDNVELGTFDMACAIYYGAKKYMLPHLERECTCFVSLNLLPKNVCQAYELAQLFDETYLIQKCVKIMENRTKEILNDASFMDADLSTVNKILSLERLSVESELELFKAVEKYASINLKGTIKRHFLSRDDSSAGPTKIKRNDSNASQGPNCTSTTAESNKFLGPSSSNNLQESSGVDLASVRSVIGRIRFLTLPASVFADGPGRSPLLTDLERFAVLMNILSANANVPMPDGFSTSRKPRNQRTLTVEETSWRSEAVFRFTVLNLKRRTRSVESRPFLFHDLLWTVKLIPRFETNTNYIDKNYFGLYLKCTGVKGTQWAVCGSACLKLLTHDARGCDIVWHMDHTFNNKEPEAGHSHFVSWITLMDPKCYFVRNNSIDIEVHLAAWWPGAPGAGPVQPVSAPAAAPADAPAAASVSASASASATASASASATASVSERRPAATLGSNHRSATATAGPYPARRQPHPRGAPGNTPGRASRPRERIRLSSSFSSDCE